MLLADDCICFWNVWEEAGKGSSGRLPPRFTEPQPCPGLLSHVHGAAEPEGLTGRNRRENRSGKGFSAEGTEPELWRGQVREELRLQASTSLALGSRPSAREGQTEQRGWGTDAFTGLSSTVRAAHTCHLPLLPSWLPSSPRRASLTRGATGLGVRKGPAGAWPVTRCSTHTPALPAGCPPVFLPVTTVPSYVRVSRPHAQAKPSPACVYKRSPVETV